MKLFIRAAAVLAIAASLSFSAPQSASVSASDRLQQAARFATLWRAAQLELAMVLCSTIQCADLVGRLRSVGAGYQAGGDLAGQYSSLGAAVVALGGELHREAVAMGGGALAADALGSQLFARSSSLHSSGPVALNSRQDACNQGCYDRFAVVAAVCSVLPPPLDAFCIGTAVIALYACLDGCSNGGGGGGQGGCLVEVCSDPGALPAGTPSAARVLDALPRLAPYFSGAELNQIARDVGVVLGGH